jgi:hypothetical protein
MLVTVSHFALVVNSSINIVIYTFKDDKFRNVMLYTFGWKRNKVLDPDEAENGVTGVEFMSQENCSRLQK